MKELQEQIKRVDEWQSDGSSFRQAAKQRKSVPCAEVSDDAIGQRPAGEKQSHSGDPLLNLVAESANVLLTCPDIHEAVSRALAILGEGIGVDRVYIFENSFDPDAGELPAGRRFEWSKDGIAGRTENPRPIPLSYRDFFPRWQRMLPDGHTIKGLIKDFPRSEREFLQQQGILSLLVLPVLVEGRFWGFIGFDDCHEEKDWTESEELLLSVAAGNMVNAIERKRIEASFREAENQYRTIFESTGNATAILEEDTTISLVNAKFAHLSGYSRDEIEGRKSWTEFIVEEDLERLMEYHRLRRIDPSGAPEEFEAKLMDRKGDIHTVYVTIAMLPGTRKRVMSLMDMTHLKTVENALKKSEANYQVLFENAGVAIAHVDKQGNFLNANDTFLEFIGYSREDLKNVNALDITHPDYVEQTGNLVAKQISGEINRFSQEKYYIRKDGGLIWGQMRSTPLYDERGALHSAVVTIIDRTRRKQAEEALVQSEALYRSLFDNAPIGMFQTSLEGRFLRANKALASMLGYDSAEELIASITDLRTSTNTDLENRNSGLAALVENKDWFYDEQEYFRKDGSIMIGKVAIRRILKKDGTIDFIEGIVEDVTEQKKFKEALMESEIELRLRAQELMEANTTMRVLLKTIEKDQIELQERILSNIREQVLPTFAKLKKTQLNDVQKGCIDIAETCLDEIASPFVRTLTSTYLNLTKKEVMIAFLIKEGKTSKEIAELVNVSKRDIDFHRGKIREKLGLKNEKGNLQILLRTFK